MTPPLAVPKLGLLDTSVVIDLPTLSTDKLPALPTISSVTLAELSVGPQLAKDGQTKQARQLTLQQTALKGLTNDVSS